MNRLAPFALLIALGCGGKAATAPVTPPPVIQPSCIQRPTVNTKLSPGKVGVLYPATGLMKAPAKWALCGVLPPGFRVTEQNGNLLYGGKPTAAGTYTFWIVP